MRSNATEADAVRPRGFTLIELLVVLAVVALLLTLALPRYFQSIDVSKEAILEQLAQGGSERLLEAEGGCDLDLTYVDLPLELESHINEVTLPLRTHALRIEVLLQSHLIVVMGRYHRSLETSERIARSQLEGVHRRSPTRGIRGGRGRSGLHSGPAPREYGSSR